jgi:hypothetical protein
LIMYLLTYLTWGFLLYVTPNFICPSNPVFPAHLKAANILLCLTKPPDRIFGIHNNDDTWVSARIILWNTWVLCLWLFGCLRLP